MGLKNFFNNIGKMRSNSGVFAKFLFFPTPDGKMSVQVRRLDPHGNVFIEVNSFQNDFEFWMIGGHILKWFANLSYTTSHYIGGFLKEIFDYVVLALGQKNPLQTPDGFVIDPTQSKMPYAEIVISKSTHRMQVLAYNISVGKAGSLTELYMLGLTIRHLITIYPRAQQLFLKGFDLLIKMHQTGYPLTNMEKGTSAVGVVMDKITEKILIDHQEESQKSDVNSQTSNNDPMPSPQFIGILSKEIYKRYQLGLLPIFAHYLEITLPQAFLRNTGKQPPSFEDLIAIEAKYIAKNWLKRQFISGGTEKIDDNTVAIKNSVDFDLIFYEYQRKLLKEDVLERASIWNTIIQFCSSMGDKMRKNEATLEKELLKKVEELPENLKLIILKEIDSIFDTIKKNGKYDVVIIDEYVGRILCLHYEIAELYDFVKDQVDKALITYNSSILNV